MSDDTVSEDEQPLFVSFQSIILQFDYLQMLTIKNPLPLCTQPFLSFDQSNQLSNEISAVLMAVQVPQPSSSSSSSSSSAQPHVHTLAPHLQMLQDELSRVANSIGGAGGGNNRITASLRGGGAANVNPVNGGRGRRMRLRNNRLQNNAFENIVQDFLINVTGAHHQGGQPMFFVGNPEDYVYGRDGLDTIVTQLLNQIDGTGPPPLARNKIAEIPKVEVTAEQVAEKLQCSVCWEDFLLAETVHKLPCLVSCSWVGKSNKLFSLISCIYL